MKRKYLVKMVEVLCLTSGLWGVSGSVLADEEPEYIEITGTPLDSGLMLQGKEPWDLSPDLSQSLARLPGVSMNTNGPVTPIAQYRGVFGERVQVQIDGAEVAAAGPNAMDSPLSHLILPSHSQVTVYRGITPVSVGGDALMGAIVSNSLDGFSDRQDWRWQGGLQATGSHQGDRHYLAGDLTLSHQAFYLRAGVQDQKGQALTDASGRVRPSDHYDRNGYRLQGGWRNGSHQLLLSFGSQKTRDTGTAALAMDIDFIDADWYRLHYQYTAEHGRQWQVKLYGNDNQHGMSNFTQRPLMMPSMARTNTVDSRGRGIEVKVRETWGAGRYTLGLDWFEAKHNSRITNPNNPMFYIQNFHQIQRQRHGGFIELEHKPMEKLEWMSGLRYTWINAEAGAVDTNMAAMNPNVASLVNNMLQSARDPSHGLMDISTQLRYQQTENVHWVLGGARKQRAPSYTELFSWFPLGVSAGLADGRNYLGNLKLNKESALQLEAGVDYAVAGWTVSPRIFYQKIDDYIQGVPSTNLPANRISMMMGAGQPLQWSNTDATLYGADMQATYRYNHHWQYDAVLSYVRGQRDDIKDDLYRIAPFSLRQALRWQNHQWQTSLEWLLMGKQSRVASVQGEEKTAGYGLINLDIQYQWSPELRMALRMDNLLDKQYSPHLTGVNRVRGTKVAVGEKLPAAGRTLYLNLRYDFGA